MSRGVCAAGLALLLAAGLSGCSQAVTGGPLVVESGGSGVCTPSDPHGVAYDSVGIVRLRGRLPAEILGVDLIGADHLELLGAVLGPGFGRNTTLLGAGPAWSPTGQPVWAQYGPLIGRRLQPGESSHDIVAAVRRTDGRGRLFGVDLRYRVGERQFRARLEAELVVMEGACSADEPQRDPD